jgi:coenzyme F420 biosynthesis associated uncharacterized protein
MVNLVDWDIAVSTASRMAGPGPEITRADADAVVAELRAGTERSTPLVRDYTGLVAEERTAPVLVVDRAGWIRANAAGFAQVMSPLLDRVSARMKERGKEPSALAEAFGSKVTGLEVGGLLGFMSSRVLGQFDPFHADVPGGADDSTAGRMLLVAPNIVHAERELGVDPSDFRLWVCLHEETHRVQFTAVPWMRDHLHAEIGRLVETVDPDPGRFAAMAGEAVKRLGDLTRGEDVSLLDLVTSPEQREVVDRLTGVMSLLEGHADVVMDGVGPEAVPSVAAIRKAFNRRRQGAGPLDRLLRRLLGFEAKMAQYRDGAGFVRATVDAVGMEGFNAVWAEPANLPSKAEISDPDAWVARVHG